MKRITLLIAASLISIQINAQTVATVNGQEITQKNLDAFVTLLVSQGTQDTEELRAQVKQEMVHRLVAVQAAEKAGLNEKEEVKQELELARQGILVRALLKDYLEKNPITDKKLKAEYDAVKKAEGDKTEYKVRHILVEDETAAKDLIASIKAKKTSFEDAAKEHSIDFGSGKNGGGLGWAQVENYVPEFASAVETQKTGEVSVNPVKSQFGWHIIEVEDSRTLEFPALEVVKPQLEEMLRQQELAKFQEELISNANIK